jgi:nucleotide-binding universal stress UspA family protein
MKTNKFPAPQTIASSTTQNPPAGGPKEILVPIDFSEASIKALRHAAELAAREHAQLTLLNVVEESPTFRTLDQPAQERRQHQEHEAQLQQLAWRELALETHAQLVVRDGIPSEEITRVAARRHAGLIVLGLHRSHGLRRWLHGHTANRVMRHAQCPVLMLGDGISASASHKIAA